MRPDCVWCQQGLPHLHASDLGQCPKGVIAERLGHKPIPHDEPTLLRFAEGRLHERDVIEDRLPAAGYVITDRQMERILDIAGTIVVTHVDGRIQRDEPVGVLNRLRVLEVKAPSKAEYNKWIDTRWDTPGLWQHYKWATSCYQYAWNEEMTVVVKCRETGRMDISVQETPFYTLDQITQRVAYIKNHVIRGELPDECPHDWFCPFKYLCRTKPNEEGQGSSPDSDELEDPIMEAAAAEFVLLGEQIKVLEARKSEMRAELESRLDGRKKAQVGRYRVTWVEKSMPESVRKAYTMSYPIVKRIEETNS